jgi:hypothetical protein
MQKQENQKLIKGKMAIDSNKIKSNQGKKSSIGNQRDKVLDIDDNCKIGTVTAFTSY